MNSPDAVPDPFPCEREDSPEIQWDGIRLTPRDPRFAHQMDAARTVMRKRRHVLRELAK
jgi:hypothetical protein